MTWQKKLLPSANPRFARFRQWCWQYKMTSFIGCCILGYCVTLPFMMLFPDKKDEPDVHLAINRKVERAKGNEKFFYKVETEEE